MSGWLAGIVRLTFWLESAFVVERDTQKEQLIYRTRSKARLARPLLDYLVRVQNACRQRARIDHPNEAYL